MIYKILYILVSINIIFSQKINLNVATMDELNSLNLTKKQINAIINYRNKIGNIYEVYDLLSIPEINANDIQSIKKYVSVEITQISTFEKDIQRASYKMGRWISNEGSTEGLSEIWLDRYFEPQNVNNMNYDDLINLPNVSPIDVTAVLKQKERGYINGAFQLKNSPGISYWGYKNLRDFIRFNNLPEHEKNKIHVRFNSLIRTIPITSNPDDDGNINAFKDSSIPEQFHKISITSGINFKAGLSYHRYMGQPKDVFTLKTFLQSKNNKIFNLNFEKIILGNYTLSFGQGVIIETNDNFSPRRTGYGFTKRAEGIQGDITRSCQYVLQGAAIQIKIPNFRGIFFSSLHPRDAIINSDSSFTSLIVMQPRLPYGANNDATKIYHSLIGSINELTWGGNLRFTPIIGTNIGFTFFESLYNRKHIPQIKNTITGGDDSDYSGDDHYLVYISNSADSEIEAMDYSEAQSPFWSNAQSYFRARGFDFSTVISNIAIQGEYGEMLKDNNILKFGRSPSALVLSVYAQFENFNILALYRNYDLKYDNPYQRSYSNYQRYKSTIFEDGYWLEDPIYSYLHSGNPQPQAEEGFFISSRYQFHRSIVGYLNWDTWNRKADNTKYFRTVTSMEWRPVFNFRIKIRQKWQARGTFNISHPSPYYSRETRITTKLRMSRYNQFELLFSNGNTTFAPRPRLTVNPLGSEMMVGDIGSPDKTIGASITHHFNNTFTIKSGFLHIQGFLWYIEDTDFRVFSSENSINHFWTAFDLHLTNLFRVILKMSYSNYYPTTTIDSGETSNYKTLQNPLVSKEDMDFRFQLTYAL